MKVLLDAFALVALLREEPAAADVEALLRRGRRPAPLSRSRLSSACMDAAGNVAVADSPERSRFEVRVEGELAGFAQYRRRPGQIAFTHTEIDPRFEGRGLGGRLVRTALDASRGAGLAVLPHCPFVRGYIAGHLGDYLDLVPEDRRAGFELPARA